MTGVDGKVEVISHILGNFIDRWKVTLHLRASQSNFIQNVHPIYLVSATLVARIWQQKI
jgi:hypothetical protein